MQPHENKAGTILNVVEQVEELHCKYEKTKLDINCCNQIFNE